MRRVLRQGGIASVIGCVTLVIVLSLCRYTEARISAMPGGTHWQSSASQPTRIQSARASKQTNLRGGKYVHVDAATGDLVISYPERLGAEDFADNPGPIKTLRYVLPNKILPIVRVSVRKDTRGGFVYDYSIQDGASVEQPITAWFLALDSPDFVTEKSGSGLWKGLQTPRPTPANPAVPFHLEPPAYLLLWFPRGTGRAGSATSGAIQPSEAATFNIRSPARPGFVRAFFDGQNRGDPTEDMPDDVAREIEPFLRLENKTKRRMLGPAFALNTPTNLIAMRLRESAEQLIQEREVDSQSPFVREAITYLAARSSAESKPVSIRFQNKPTNEAEHELEMAIQLDMII
jgi:hypothetical protein